jgi:hypothetical protein
MIQIRLVFYTLVFHKHLTQIYGSCDVSINLAFPCIPCAMASAYVDARYLTVNIAAGDQPNIVNTMGNREFIIFPSFPFSKPFAGNLRPRRHTSLVCQRRFLEPEPRMLERHEASAHRLYHQVDLLSRGIYRR